MIRAAGAERVLEGVRILADAAGASGMVGGQLLDIRAGGQVQGSGELEEIHRRKTGAMIRASVYMGGLMGGADDAQLDALARYGEKAGLAFQIVDDVLDVEGDAALLGKSTGSDEAQDKGDLSRPPRPEGPRRRWPKRPLKRRLPLSPLSRRALPPWLRWPGLSYCGDSELHLA